MKRSLALALLAVFSCSSVAFAQDDDDLAPIAPKKAPPKAAPKKAAPKKAPPPAAKAKLDDDDDLAPIGAARGELSVKLPQNLSNAILSIDGKDVVPFPSAPQSLTAGEHSVRVRRIGYADFVKKVTISNGKTFELDAKLQAINAVVSVTSDVADAQVLVNGRLVGTAPISELELPAGSTEISVRKEGFQEDKQRVTLVAGKDYPIVVKFRPGTTSTVVATGDRPVDTRLTPDDTSTSGTPGLSTTAEETPLVGRWYFWAGVAAVVVGAAVVTTVAVSNNQPQRKLDEKTVCAVNGGRCDICVGFQCSAGLASGVLNF